MNTAIHADLFDDSATRSADMQVVLDAAERVQQRLGAVEMFNDIISDMSGAV